MLLAGQSLRGITCCFVFVGCLWPADLPASGSSSDIFRCWFDDGDISFAAGAELNTKYGVHRPRALLWGTTLVVSIKMIWVAVCSVVARVNRGKGSDPAAS